MSEEQKRQLNQQLWNIANTLRGKMNADEFRDYILGFIFYKYLSEKMEIYANTILKQDKISKNTSLNYTRYPTAKYFIRIIYDENRNGKWDTGNVRLKVQPEKSWTFEKTITLRPNWDLEENITIPAPD